MPQRAKVSRVWRFRNGMLIDNADGFGMLAAGKKIRVEQRCDV